MFRCHIHWSYDSILGLQGVWLVIVFLKEQSLSNYVYFQINLIKPLLQGFMSQQYLLSAKWLFLMRVSNSICKEEKKLPSLY